MAKSDHKICPDCGGSGKESSVFEGLDVFDTECSRCGGSGQIDSEE